MQKQTVHLFVFDTLSDWEPGYADFTGWGNVG